MKASWKDIAKSLRASCGIAEKLEEKTIGLKAGPGVGCGGGQAHNFVHSCTMQPWVLWPMSVNVYIYIYVARQTLSWPAEDELSVQSH